jgi:hypothetical protein
VLAGAEADGPLVPWNLFDGVPVELQDRDHALGVLRGALRRQRHDHASFA